MSKRSSNKIIYLRADSEELKIHPIAQRRLSQVKRKRMYDNLDLDAIGTLHAVERDGIFYVVDGQHRLSAILDHGLGDWQVRIEVHVHVTTEKGASDLFLKLGDRLAVQSFEKYVNRVAAGEENAVAVAEILQDRGIGIARASRDGHLAALGQAQKMQEKGVFEGALDIHLDAWGPVAAALEGKLLEGTGILLANHGQNGSFDRKAFTRKLSKYPGGAYGVLADGRGLQKIRRGSVGRAVAEILVDTYNRGRSEKGRLSASGE